MSVKTLKPSTIIPIELYVERAADRQLRQIIEDMGRPGYVLVARQMGKTNLLLHARRNMENDDCKFVYVDLSRKPNEIDKFYELIIQTFLDVHGPALGFPIACRDFMTAGSSAINVTPQERFETALRRILSAFCGRVIIVLDEVDSLIGSGYSDKVFSQIRSIYFARSNHSDYERLTFILSGVAEPSDLIKDKTVSPFNIGEKIYLSDFSADEHNIFIEKSGLPVPQIVRDRVFHWARGNPRITWDILSRIEDIIRENKFVSSEAVDNVVEELYLAGFDRAPVDHIRTIIETDREARRGVLEIRQGHSAQLSDALRSRLYLSGVIATPRSKTPAEIKNPIIDRALSSGWLDDLSSKFGENLDNAHYFYKENKFEAAISYYEQYLAEAAFETRYEDSYFLASSYYQAERFKEALNHLTAVIAAEPPVEIIGGAYRIAGMCHFALGDVAEAIASLRSSLIVMPDQANVATNLAAFLFKEDAKLHAPEIIKLNKDVLELLTSTPDRSDVNDADIGAVALVNLAKLAEFQSNLTDANIYISRAIAAGSPAAQPALALLKVNLVVDADERHTLISNIVRFIINNRLKPVHNKTNKALEFTNADMIRLIALSGAINDDSVYSDFIDYLKKEVFDDKYQDFELCALVFEGTPDGCTNAENTALAEFAVRRFRSLDAASQVVGNACKNIIINGGATDEVVSYYLDFFGNKGVHNDIDDNDFLVFYTILGRLTKDRNPNLLRRSIQASEELRIRSEVEPVDKILYSLVLLRLMTIFASKREVDKANKCAYDILALIEEERASDSTSPLPESVLTGIEETAQAHLQSNVPLKRLSNPYRHLGRNQKVVVRYPDGTSVEKKFKFVQRDLVCQKCVLISPEPDDRNSKWG